MFYLIQKSCNIINFVMNNHIEIIPFVMFANFFEIHDDKLKGGEKRECRMKLQGKNPDRVILFFPCAEDDCATYFLWQMFSRYFFIHLSLSFSLSLSHTHIYRNTFSHSLLSLTLLFHYQYQNG